MNEPSCSIALVISLSSYGAGMGGPGIAAAEDGGPAAWIALRCRRSARNVYFWANVVYMGYILLILLIDVKAQVRCRASLSRRRCWGFTHWSM